MNQKLLALYGLKFNPFSPELPVEAIYVPSRIESFCWRIEHAQIREGGFAMIHGDPGSGKSVVLRVLAQRLKRLPDVTVAAINHPQSHLADFYRELGDVFGVPLRPSNRWGGFKALRERWLSHMESTRCRAVLLVDEAQEMTPQVLSELRLLASSQFDSQPLLCIVMAGDARLLEKLRREELIPLGSRIRTRLATEFASREELALCLEHLIAGAGNASWPLSFWPLLRSGSCPCSMKNCTLMSLHQRQSRRSVVWLQDGEHEEKTQAAAWFVPMRIHPCVV